MLPPLVKRNVWKLTFYTPKLAESKGMCCAPRTLNCGKPNGASRAFYSRQGSFMFHILTLSNAKSIPNLSRLTLKLATNFRKQKTPAADTVVPPVGVSGFGV